MVMCVTMYEKDPDKTEKFVEEVKEGVGLTANSPSKILRDYLMEADYSGGQSPTSEIYQKSICAAEACLDGGTLTRKTLKVATWREDRK
jgi:hypothetical protein